MNEATASRRVLNVELRRLDPRDIETAVPIDERSYPAPWNAAEFYNAAFTNWHESRAARMTNQLVGYALYHAKPTRFDVLRLAVDPAYRRRAVGLQLLAEIQAKATVQQRIVRVDLWEYHTEGQLLLRAAGFRCVEVMRDFYHDEAFDGSHSTIDGHAAYRFEWKPEPHRLSLVCSRAATETGQRCDGCGHPIYVSPATDDIAARVPSARLLCTSCGRNP